MSFTIPCALPAAVGPNVDVLRSAWACIDGSNALAPATSLDPRRMFDDGQEALETLAQAAQHYFRQSPPDLVSLRWSTPSVLRKTSWKHPVALWLSCIAFGMDELCNIDWLGAHDQKDRTKDLLDLAATILLYCSGEGFSYWNAEGVSVRLPSIVHNEQNETAALRRAFFDCTALVLCQLARTHSIKMAEHSESGTVHLWQQQVPSRSPPTPQIVTNGSSLLLSSTPTPGHFHAVTPKQEQRWKDLHKDLVDLLRMNQASQTERLARINKAIGIISRTVQSQDKSIVGSTTDEYREELFKHAKLALGDILQMAQLMVNRQETDSLVLELFQPSSDGRPQAVKSSNKSISINEKRRWAILTLLDRQFRLRASDPERISTVLQLMRLCSGHSTTMFTKEQSDVPLVDYVDFVDVPKNTNVHSIPPITGLPMPRLPTAAATEAWRKEMWVFLKYVILGLAQFMSASFKRDVVVWDNRVIEYDQVRYCSPIKEETVTGRRREFALSSTSRGRYSWPC